MNRRINPNMVEVIGGLGIIAIGIWLIYMNSRSFVEGTIEEVR